MQPGEALDAIVAEKVMGWKDRGDTLPHKPECPGYKDGMCGCVIPHYSTSIEDAWQVVEKVGSDFFVLSRGFTERGKWDAAFSVGPNYGRATVSTDSPAYSICLAALIKTVSGS